MMDMEKLHELRQRILSGEEIPPEELRPAIDFMTRHGQQARQIAAARSPKRAPKTQLSVDDIRAQLGL